MEGRAALHLSDEFKRTDIAPNVRAGGRIKVSGLQLSIIPGRERAPSGVKRDAHLSAARVLERVAHGRVALVGDETAEDDDA